jgi:hypothetical protein
MEAVPLSDTSTAACAKALTFTLISRFDVPETITSDRDPQFTSNLWFKLFKMLHISHKQTTTYHPESKGAVKRLLTASRTPFVHAPPRQLGPRSYLLCSSDSEHSRGKTLVFPWLRQFLALPLCCLMNFCKTKKCQLMLLSKNFQKPCMFLTFLCLGTILAPSCRRAARRPPIHPPRLGPAGRGHPTPSAALRWPLRCPALQAPLLHYPSRVPGRGHRRQLPQGLHGRGRHAWQPASPWQTAGFAPRQSCRNQAGLIFRPAGFFIFPSGAATRRSRNRFPTQRGGFCTPGTGGAIISATDAVPVPSMDTATGVGPLTSSPPG